MVAVLAVVVASAVVARQGLDFTGFVSGFGAFVLVVLSAIDLERRRIPNAIVLPAAAAVLVLRVLADPDAKWQWLGAGLGAFLVFFFLALLRPGGLGMGDAKLALLIGFLLGRFVLEGLAIGTLAGAGAALVVLVQQGREARTATLAYAPFLSFGAILMLLLVQL